MKSGKFFEIVEKYPWILEIMGVTVEGSFLDLIKLQKAIQEIDYVAFRPFESVDWNTCSLLQIVTKGKEVIETWSSWHLFWHFETEDQGARTDQIGFIIPDDPDGKRLEDFYTQHGGKENLERIWGDQSNLKNYLRDFPRWTPVMWRTLKPFHFDAFLRQTLIKNKAVPGVSRRYDIYLFPERFKIEDIP